MKRIALVFLIAILLPAGLLAVLAVRSVRDQEVITENQRAVAFQAACEARATEINLFLDDVRIFYGRFVDEFAQSRPVADSVTFSDHVRSGWTQAAVGAVVTDGGAIVSPRPGSDAREQAFLENHSDFLTNRRVVEVYEAPRLLNSQVKLLSENPPSVRPAEASVEEEGSEARNLALTEKSQSPSAQAAAWKVGISQNRLQEFRFDRQGGRGVSQVEDVPEREDSIEERTPPQAEESSQLRKALPGESPEAELASAGATSAGAGLPEEDRRPVPASATPLGRTVAPVQYGSIASPGAAEGVQQDIMDNNYSQLSRERVLFNDLAETEREGAVSRIIDGELHVLLWKRPEAQPDRIFWVELDLDEIRKDLGELFEEPKGMLSSIPAQPEMSLALLDTKGELVTQTAKGFATDWARPFVAAEVGQILPRWEVAAYLLNPDAVSQSAKTVRLLLGWLVGLSFVTVAVGSFLIFRSVDYEMRMASRKTDFVSSVSHELKTPLTSIRMFSDLLAKSENPDFEKTKQYSEVISKESARLSRLIHRLLDFSRMERDEMKLSRDAIDLAELIPETVDQVRPQLEACGIELGCSIPSASSMVKGDADAIAQVLLNLLSNAEKYAAGGGEVAVDLVEVPGKVIVSVHDRGPGIPKGQQRKIFEKFYRVDESIDSGIEGSGIGLSLSHQIMDKLGGSLRYEPRPGGGSSFSMHFPATGS